MAKITFPIVASELHVDVRINLAAPDLARIVANRQPAPASVLAKATLDTGSNVTGVSAALLRQLPLVPIRQSNTQGIGGPVSVYLYHISLSIFDATQAHVPWFTLPDLQVMELPVGTPVDVLIGMDVILNCRLLIDGPGQTFTIDF